MKFTKNAHLEGEGRIIDTDEATVYLTDDDKKVQRMELRGNARITSTGQQTNGAQSMNAQAIDLAYGEDGRTLQTAKLVDNANVTLPGAANAARSVAGRTIDIVMAPDGSTVTSLIAQENVQVDLPADGDTPARRIKSASLAASGAPGAGLQNASFTGGVDYREARAEKKGVAAIDRTARSQRLDVQTKPGFGDLERADFHGNVHFTDGADTTADAPLAVYAVAQDRLDLSPSGGDPGIGPHVANGRITVDAARIQMTLGTQSLTADTKVKSVLKSENKNQPPPTSKPAGRGGRAGAPAPVAPLPAAQSSDSVKMPSILKSSEPVNVTANRLEYDGNASRAVYTGAARLWQPDTVVRADKITLDEKTGNLHAVTGVVTVMTLAEPSDKPKPNQKATDATKKPPSAPTTTTAEELVYEDAAHRATYTTKAHMNGPDGDVTAEKIELYLTENGGELERAEADGNVVSRQQDQQRRAYGDHLTYLSAKDEYTMVGKPVKVFDDRPPDCKVTVGTTLTFHKAVDTISATGNGVSAGTKTETIACGTAGQP
jgi:lipopolysaccharide export system protein LptA